MANGYAAIALKPLASEHLSEDVPAAAPAAIPGAATEIELNEAVADAATMICKAILNYWRTGVLDPATKDAGATRIARVALLALDFEGGDLDFIHKARVAGKRELRCCFTDDYVQRHGPAAADMTIGLVLDTLFMIVDRVVKSERALRAAQAH